MEGFKLWKNEWRFPSNDYGQIFGIADSGVETFKGTPMKSLAREICQNSIDAGVDNQTVNVEFQTFQIKRDAVPHFDQLMDAFHCAEEFWSVQHSQKAVKFFKNAQKAGQKEYIRCLRISDFHTSGLTGSDQDYNSPWCNLTKSTGASDKSGTAGGSFGIGKFAPFACSDFRTVFYSTLDKDGIKAYQGVARLTSFKKDDGTVTQGTGFYGLEKNMPVRDQIFLDPRFMRPDGMSGTDIYILGFDPDEDWVTQMVVSVLDGFLYAVFSGRLIVRIEDIEISKDHLPKLMEQYKDKFKEHADEYYQVLCADEKSCPEYQLDVDGLGTAHLKILISPGLWHRVALVRGTGMKIMDRGYISNIIPFAGIMYIEGDALNTFLRSLENPQHTKWETDRADDKKKAKKITQKLYGFIRSCFNEQKKEGGGAPLDPAVGQYLAAEDEGKQENREETLTDVIREVTLTPRTVRPPADSGAPSENPDTGVKAGENDPKGNETSTGLPGEGSGRGSGNGNGSGGGGSDEGPGPGTHPVDHKQKIVYIRPSKKRAVCKSRKTGEYQIFYTPAVSAANGYLEVFIAAESGDYSTDAVSASLSDGTPLKVEQNRITGLTFEAGKPLKINLKLDFGGDYCSMEVKGYGHTV